jgi:hypothetical protein
VLCAAAAAAAAALCAAVLFASFAAAASLVGVGETGAEAATASSTLCAGEGA